MEFLGFKYPEGLTKLQESHVKKLREAYMARISEFCENYQGQVVIDKLPLNLVHLPLIWTLFPNAKILLALRHPMGSIFSNFTG